MRRSRLVSAALAAPLATLLAGAGAFAQSGTTSTGQTPAAPNASAAQPQPSNSLPPGSQTSGPNTSQSPGGNVGSTTVTRPQAARMMWLAQATAPAAPDTAPGMTGMHPMRQPRMGEGTAAHHPPRTARVARQQPAEDASGADAGLRPGQQVGTGGATSPTSSQASNIDGGTTRGEIAPRLPNPDTNANTPEAYLAAANRALQRNQTGAAQEALERAETRLLDRSTDPSMANTPSSDPRAQSVAQARQALARRDVAGARRAIQMAMNGPAPMGQPMGGQPMRQPTPMGMQPMGQPMMQPGMTR